MSHYQPRCWTRVHATHKCINTSFFQLVWSYATVSTAWSWVHGPIGSKNCPMCSIFVLLIFRHVSTRTCYHGIPSPLPYQLSYTSELPSRRNSSRRLLLIYTLGLPAPFYLFIFYRKRVSVINMHITLLCFIYCKCVQK